MILLLNHIAAVSLLIAYLAPYISPENFWIIAFFGLVYPYLVIINFLFIVYWALRLKEAAFYSFIIIISGWTQLNNYIQFNKPQNDSHSSNSIKVMSYNVKLFDLYDWTHNTETSSKMFELMKKEQPDILCIQEFFTRDSTNKFKNLDTLLTFPKSQYKNIEYTTTMRKIDHWGIAIFSNYPIINNGKITFSENSNNICIYSDLLINKDTVRVYNVHLQSIKFEPVDYEFMDNFMNKEETEELEKSKHIIKRLKLAYIKRSKQTEIVSNHVKASPYPIIICGDFNDVAASYTYKTISDKLSDAFLESGSGFGRSYAREFPSLRIDYILHSNIYKGSGFRTIQKKLSDHYPIVTYLEKK